MRCRPRSLLAWLVIAVAAVTVTGLGLWLPKTASGQSATLSIGAPSSVAAGGADFQVTVSVQGVTNLGSYEWQLSFDPALLQFKTATNGPFLGTPERPAACRLIQPPGIDLDGDTIVEPPLETVMPAGNVRFGCNTSGSAPGPNGSGLLSTVTFSPLASGSPNIQFVCAGLTNPLGDSIPVSNVIDCMGPVTATPGPGDTPVPTSTPTPGGPTATPTPTGPLPTPTPLPPGLEAVHLVAGCNAVASTYPDATPIQTIADRVGHAGNLTSVWKFQLGTWLGYSPQFPEVSDLTETDFLDALFICVNSPGAFVRPIV